MQKKNSSHNKAFLTLSPKTFPWIPWAGNRHTLMWNIDVVPVSASSILSSLGSRATLKSMSPYLRGMLNHQTIFLYSVTELKNNNVPRLKWKEKRKHTESFKILKINSALAWLVPCEAGKLNTGLDSENRERIFAKPLSREKLCHLLKLLKPVQTLIHHSLLTM